MIQLLFQNLIADRKNFSKRYDKVILSHVLSLLCGSTVLHVKKNLLTGLYLEKYKFYREMFQIKIIGYKLLYELIITVSLLKESPRLCGEQIMFFKWNDSIFIPESDS